EKSPPPSPPPPSPSPPPASPSSPSPHAAAIIVAAATTARSRSHRLSVVFLILLRMLRLLALDVVSRPGSPRRSPVRTRADVSCRTTAGRARLRVQRSGG